VEQRDTSYLHDGWNLVAELDANSSNATLRTYVWGTDLSGNRAGAGGVGGLLWVNNSQSTGGMPTGIQFVAYDGNGNVAGLFAAADGGNTARYEYGPFGESLRATGPLAGANPIRWSTKVTDDEGGLVYYGYRFYCPSTGRWLSRDPLAEAGEVALYSMVDSDPVNEIDYLGLKKKKVPGLKPVVIPISSLTKCQTLSDVGNVREIHHILFPLPTGMTPEVKAAMEVIDNIAGKYVRSPVGNPIETVGIVFTGAFQAVLTTSPGYDIYLSIRFQVCVRTDKNSRIDMEKSCPIVHWSDPRLSKPVRLRNKSESANHNIGIHSTPADIRAVAESVAADYDETLKSHIIDPNDSWGFTPDLPKGDK
jgi:RHS repeat-associated protein